MSNPSNYGPAKKHEPLLNRVDPAPLFSRSWTVPQCTQTDLISARLPQLNVCYSISALSYDRNLYIYNQYSSAATFQHAYLRHHRPRGTHQRQLRCGRCPGVCSKQPSLPQTAICILTCARSQRPCVDQVTTGSGIAGCNKLDTNCICSNQDFLSNIACCLVDKCDEAGRTAAIAYAKTICATADPPVTVPDEVVCNSAASTTGGSTTGGATTQAPTGVTSTPTSAAQTSSSSGAAMVNMGSTGMGLAGGFAAALVLL